MLLLSAHTSREIVNAIKASAESNVKSMDANTEALKDLKSKVGGMNEVLERLENKVDSKTDA